MHYFHSMYPKNARYAHALGIKLQGHFLWTDFILLVQRNFWVHSYIICLCIIYNYVWSSIHIVYHVSTLHVLVTLIYTTQYLVIYQYTTHMVTCGKQSVTVKGNHSIGGWPYYHSIMQNSMYAIHHVLVMFVCLQVCLHLTCSIN